MSFFYYYLLLNNINYNNNYNNNNNINYNNNNNINYNNNNNIDYNNNKNNNNNYNYNNTPDFIINNKIGGNNKFNEWLAGLIDGDGYFHLSKSGTARLKIVMDIRDNEVLYKIKHKFGGSIKKVSNGNTLKYQLSNKKGLIVLINSINGLIRNPTRMLQMNQLCKKYNIELIYPKPLNYNNGWLSGFIDSDGSVYYVKESKQIIISASQKNSYLLEPLINLYGGKLYPHNSKKEAFKYVIYRKKEVINLIDNYFIKYPLLSKKQNRLNLVKEFYLYLNNYLNNNNKDIAKFNEFIKLLNKWDTYN